MTRLTVSCEVKNVFINPGGEIIIELKIGYKNNSMKHIHITDWINISKIIERLER